MSDLIAKLTELKALLDAGLLTREEFDHAKGELMGTTGGPRTAAAAPPPPTPPATISAPAVDPMAMLSGGTRMATSPPSTTGPGGVAPQALVSGVPSTATGPQASSITSPPVAAAAGPGEELRIGVTLAHRYIITRKLGEGGMGQVFLAMDKDTEQEVAVKVIAPRLAGDPAMLEGLRREVATARGLGVHPNLLRILDLHLRENPPFLAMEVASGGDLQEYWLAHARKLEPDDAVVLLEQILSGLEALHAARVVHQDIKPQNILLASDGSVRITDYGISRSLRDQVESGGVDGSGTLVYMSPEQLAGQICDRRADLYSVGIMAHQLVTGRFPFTASTEAEIEAWHRSGSRELGPLPSPFDAVIPRLIAIDPDARFRSAAEVLEALSAARAMPEETTDPALHMAPEPVVEPEPPMASEPEPVADKPKSAWEQKADQLRSLKALLEEGLINESEFEQKKQVILSAPAPAPEPAAAPEVEPYIRVKRAEKGDVYLDIHDGYTLREVHLHRKMIPPQVFLSTEGIETIYLSPNLWSSMHVCEVLFPGSELELKFSVTTTATILTKIAIKTITIEVIRGPQSLATEIKNPAL